MPFTSREEVKEELIAIEAFNNEIHREFENTKDYIKFCTQRNTVDSRTKEIILWYVDHCNSYPDISQVPRNDAILRNIVYGHLKLTQIFRSKRGMMDGAKAVSFWRDLEFLIKFKIGPDDEEDKTYKLDDVEQINLILHEVVDVFKEIFRLDDSYEAINDFLKDRSHYATLNSLVSKARKIEFLRDGQIIIQKLREIIQNEGIISEMSRIKFLYNIQLLGELYVKIHDDQYGKMKLLKDVRNKISDTEQDFRNNLYNFIKNRPSDDTESYLFDLRSFNNDLVEIEQFIASIASDDVLVCTLNLAWLEQFNTFAIKGKKNINPIVKQYADSYFRLIEKFKEEVNLFVDIMSTTGYKDLIEPSVIEFILKDFNGTIMLESDIKDPSPEFLPICFECKEQQNKLEDFHHKFVSHRLHEGFSKIEWPEEVKQFLAQLEKMVKTTFTKIREAIRTGVKPVVIEAIFDAPFNLATENEITKILDIFINIRKLQLDIFNVTSHKDLDFWQKSQKLNDVLKNCSNTDDEIIAVKFLASRIARISSKILQKVNENVITKTSDTESILKIDCYLLQEIVAYRNYVMHGLPLFEVIKGRSANEFRNAILMAAKCINLKSSIEAIHSQYGWHARCDSLLHDFNRWVGTSFQLYQEAANELQSSPHAAHTDSTGGRVTPVLLRP